MHFLLYFIAVLAFLAGSFTTLVAKTAMQEIVAGEWFIISAIAMSAAGIIGAVHALRREVTRQPPPPST